MAAAKHTDAGGPAKSAAPPARYRRRAVKFALWSGAALTLIALAAVLFIPAVVDLDIFRRTYLPLIEEALQRRVRVGEVRLTLLPTPSIRLSRLEIADSPAYPDNTFFVAQQVRLRLKLWPLLRGRLEVTEFVVNKPVVNLLKRPDGSFNYADLAGKNLPVVKKSPIKTKPAAPKAQEPAIAPLVLPSRMRINNGVLKVTSPGQRTIQIDGIQLALTELTGDEPFFYRASFNYPGLKNVSLEGRLRYHPEQAALTVKDNRFQAQDLELQVEGTVTQLSTVPHFELRAASDRVEAKVIGQILSVFELMPPDTEFSGPVAVHLALTGLSHSAAAELKSRLKDIKITGKRTLNGKLSGELIMKIPLARGALRHLQGSGTLTARDGELTNAELVKRIQRATAAMGLTKAQGREATKFKTLEADFTVSNGLAEFSRIRCINPQVEVNGTGTMTLEHPKLDLAVETTLSRQLAARAPKARSVSVLKDSQGRIIVPLKVSGPVESPMVNLDSERIVEKGMTGPQERSFSALVKQLFRR
jgi:AsmA protein